MKKQNMYDVKVKSIASLKVRWSGVVTVKASTVAEAEDKAFETFKRMHPDRERAQWEFKTTLKKS